MRLDEAITIARNSLWLSSQSAAFQNDLGAIMRLISISKGEPVFHMEDEARDIYCVVKGNAVISVPHPVEGIMAAHVLSVGKWFGEPATLGQRPRIMSVVARQPCHLVTVSRSSVELMLRAKPDYAWNFFNLMAVNVEDYLNHAVDLLIQDPKRRLYSRMLTYGGRLIYHLPESPVTIPLSQEELAVSSNMSRSTVYQLLTELVDAGICKLGYREIKVLDMKALAALVQR